jgi:hypothetical protein
MKREQIKNNLKNLLYLFYICSFIYFMYFTCQCLCAESVLIFGCPKIFNFLISNESIYSTNHNENIKEQLLQFPMLLIIIVISKKLSFSYTI